MTTLEEYLKKLEDLSDDLVLITDEFGSTEESRFTAEHGVFDNWPILLDADFDEIKLLLEKRGQFRYREMVDGGTRYIFDYLPGTVELQIINSVWQSSCLGSNEEKERQQREYKIMLMLHPYLENEMEGVSKMKAIAVAIGEIGKYVLEEKIPACFPRSVGWLHPEDFSEIVCYCPNE
tara:strand:+ start:1349 stop:1882 length:534 start_codon:yes stop_codon:yes gene_type:complete